MSIRNISLAAVVAGALSAVTATAQAAPLPGAAELKAQAGTNVDKAAYRRCWIHHGIRHCRWVGYYDDDAYGYYGYGPGIGFSIGGRGGHFGGGHFHGHHR